MNELKKLLLNKRILLLSFAGLLFVSICTTSCTETDIYIVRHAEKDTIPLGNPRLTNKGQLRAEELSEVLKDKNIMAVYSTNTVRTIATAHPTADLKHLPVFIYDSIPSLIASLPLKNHENILIVGHSNTILNIAEALGTHPVHSSIDDNDFDNLLIVKKRCGIFGSSVEIEETTYGVASP